MTAPNKATTRRKSAAQPAKAAAANTQASDMRIPTLSGCIAQTHENNTAAMELHNALLVIHGQLSGNEATPIEEADLMEKSQGGQLSDLGVQLTKAGDLTQDTLELVNRIQSLL